MRCWALGADDFLPKPVRPDQLDAKIRAVFASGSAPRTKARNERVLLATQDPFQQNQVSLFLECNGYRVRRADTTGHVTSALEEHGELFDVAVCEASMFAGSRMTVLDQIRVRPKTKLVVLVPERVDAHQAAVFSSWPKEHLAFVSPPHTPEMVLSVVDGLLKRVMGDLRLAERVPFYNVVEFRVTRDEPWASGFTHDLSPSGLFVRTLTPAPKGTSIEFRFREWTPANAIEGRALVAWSNEYGPRATYSYPVGMGLQLSFVDSAASQRLQAWYERARQAAKQRA